MQRYQFKIKDLDCAMCAKSIEEQLQKLSWINSASVNFNTEKIVVTTEREDNILADITKVAKAVEPGCSVMAFEQGGVSTQTKKKPDWFIPVFWTGFVIGLAGILIDHLTELNTLALALMCVGAALMLIKTCVRAVLKAVRSHSVDENLLITISVVGALAINQGMEGLMVIMLYQIGKFLEQKAVDKTRNSVTSLVLVKPNTVAVKVGAAFVDTPIEDVEEGSIIQIKAGEIVPLDGIILSGSCSLDVSSLTGESVPLDVTSGDQLMSGSINLDGLLEVKTIGTDNDSTITKILSLIETASERKAKSETIVSRAAKYYVPIVIACALVVGLCFGLFSDIGIKESIYRGMIFLVVSCPCAVAISVPLSYFSGIGNASSKGILVKGTNYLDNISNIRTVAFDKTGTITTGNFSLNGIEILDESYTNDEILKLAYLGERGSTHPIAKAIVEHSTQHIAEWNSDPVQPENVREEAGRGISYVLDCDLIEVGRTNGNTSSHLTAVAVRVNGKDVANIYLSDTIKEGAKEAIAYLHSKGIATKMLTGDNEAVAAAVAKEVGIDSYAAGMLPKAKFDEMERLLAGKRKESDVIAYAGDGINDAPVLGRADIGIAMGLSGSAATVDTADVVLMNDDLRQFVTLHKLSKFTRMIVGENIWATLGIKLTFVILGMTGITGLAWAVFADVGLTICTILNSLRVLRHGGDKADKNRHHSH